MVSNRGFCTGFLLGNPDKEDYNLVNSAYIKNYDFIGVIKKYDSKLNVMLIEQRNRFFKYDKVEIVTPSMEIFDIIIDNIIDMDGNEIDSAPHPQQLLYIPCSFPVTEYCIMRKKSIKRGTLWQEKFNCKCDFLDPKKALLIKQVEELRSAGIYPGLGVVFAGNAKDAASI